MAVPSVPTNFTVQTANSQVFLMWDINVLAASYTVQRSTNQISWSAIATAITPHVYLDDTVTVGTEYFYRVFGINGDGAGSPTAAVKTIPVPTAEMSLWQLRVASQRRADKTESQFITLPEWNDWIRLSMYELYDLLLKTSEDYKVSTATLTTASSQQSYDLPNGVNYSAADPFYKLIGVDIQVGGQSGRYVTLHKFNFAERNQYFYQNNNGGTPYGFYDMKYRLVGNQIMFMPTPAPNQTVKLWYNPRLAELLQDTDITDIGISGWLQYVIDRTAKYALDKEESDSTGIESDLNKMKLRIEAMKEDRDAGMPSTISDTQNDYFGGRGGFGSPFGGF